MNQIRYTTAKPRVSVVLAAFNAENRIEATLSSILGQAFTDFEILVIDDGSTDGTVDVLRRACVADPRIRWFTQANSGPGAARNRGIREARGELIAFMDHDDLWHPEKLSLQVAILDAQPDLAVVMCYSTVIGEDGISLGWRLGGEAHGKVYDEMIEWDMVSGGSVVMVRRSALNAVGHFDEKLRYREDWDLWIRLSRQFKFGTVSRTLVGFTRHARNSSRDYEEMAREGERVLRKTLADDPDIGEARIRFCLARDMFAIACLCGIDLNRRLAWQYLVRSWRITPLPLLVSPRRWAFVGVLLMQTVLPRRMYLVVFHLLGRLVFHLQPGRTFLTSAEIQ
jgi:glycosyltransferase involved in cell wall biosynthesis